MPRPHQKPASRGAVQALARIERIYTLNLPGIPKAVLQALDWHADAGGACHPGIARICQITGFSRNAVFAAITKLEDLGILTVSRTPQRANRYLIHLPQTGPSQGLTNAKSGPSQGHEPVLNPGCRSARTDKTAPRPPKSTPRKSTHIAGILACRACGVRPSADGEGGKCLDCRREDRKSDRNAQTLS